MTRATRRRATTTILDSAMVPAKKWGLDRVRSKSRDEEARTADGWMLGCEEGRGGGGLLIGSRPWQPRSGGGRWRRRRRFGANRIDRVGRL
ncbi:unnamed protein product [Musa acuminata subsp. malaccensis]|uniref:(wild Malaysian banana) hypothetical protein n=1 Tax=Musa acuminata subsp. malaccensis TaxID=214687 RepID=A0A8D7ALG1_MUSAM|nr:unnamed protein product [Musa acuminata subsp. malaccensis]